MEYSKSTSTNYKDLKLTTNTNVCKVSNWNFGEILVGSDEESIKRKRREQEREQEKKRLLQLQKYLLKQTQCAIDIRDHGYSYIKAGNSITK